LRARKGTNRFLTGDPRSTAASPGRHDVPNIVAVEAVDEDVPAEVEEVYGRRRHRHRRPARASGAALSSLIVQRRGSGCRVGPVTCRSSARRTARRTRGLVRSRGSTSTRRLPGLELSVYSFFRIDRMAYLLALLWNLSRGAGIGPTEYQLSK
jgi:hypothetical protein